jgi:hypothetical protein
VITLNVKAGNFDALRDLVIKETCEFMRHQSGFISANLHRNAESTKLINYGQWESRTSKLIVPVQCRSIVGSQDLLVLEKSLEHREGMESGSFSTSSGKFFVCAQPASRQRR